MKEEFVEVVKNKCDSNDDCCLKRKLLHVASDACGYTKDNSRHFEMW